ncbi:hypothetical protein HPB50_009357 [Hyalomma asiaticum]|uniref:Uncharacterized protein n=1 Tax=Hyalomma asiaticum TaxID=266040 RepID=A0ACB7TJT7_HYAAI|nr:hypothetical protein HPB50_009357 [Hyalomma asiaticum]
MQGEAAAKLGAATKHQNLAQEGGGCAQRNRAAVDSCARCDSLFEWADRIPLMARVYERLYAQRVPTARGGALRHFTAEIQGSAAPEECVRVEKASAQSIRAVLMSREAASAQNSLFVTAGQCGSRLTYGGPPRTFRAGLPSPRVVRADCSAPRRKAEGRCVIAVQRRVPQYLDH